MFAVERRSIILKYLKENGRITVEQLAEKLDVTPMTIRRDLKYLDECDLIERTFGGAVLKETLINEIPYSEKSESNRNEKIRIAEYAFSLIEEGDTVILDAGTTNMEIAKKLVNLKHIKVVTTDLMIANFLSNYKQMQVMCTGGFIQNSIGACIGTKAVEFLENINADIVFLGASSIDSEKGITTPTFDKARLKKQMVDSSEKAILVSDSSKFGSKSFAKVCSLEVFDEIVTDKKIKEEILDKIKKVNRNIKIV